jgi:hypothetical protein
MLTFHIVPEIDIDVFDNLYSQSSQYLDGGTFPWDKLPFNTPEEKKNHIFSLFNLIKKAPRSVFWEVRKGTLPLMLNAGYISKNMLLWRLGLSGVDENGSRSWLYHESYRTARDAFWEELKVAGYQMSAVEGQSVYSHAQSRQNIAELKSNISIGEVVSPGVVDIKFTKA